MLEHEDYVTRVADWTAALPQWRWYLSLPAVSFVTVHLSVNSELLSVNVLAVAVLFLQTKGMKTDAALSWFLQQFLHVRVQ